MSQKRHITKTRRSIPTAQPLPTFTFPKNRHLLVTTPSRIYAWDANGVHAVFTSGSAGILAARAIPGALAIADSHVVVLHDTKHGQEKSWGLTANNDEVRLLEHAHDGFYLTTRLTNDILHYSTARSKIQDPLPAHNSTPVALACSPNYLVSASDRPPVVYVRDLRSSRSPAMLRPQASEAVVCAIAFHPERPNVFLLAFKDGTIAAYNATDVSSDGHNGEIGRVVGLQPGVTSCAFVYGHKARAVCVSTDGRCRLVDLERGTCIRTWVSKVSLASVSVLRELIATAGNDGKVLLYDLLGLLITRVTISPERIISIEWIQGPPPKPIHDPTLRDISGTPTMPHRPSAPKPKQSRSLKPEAILHIDKMATAKSNTIVKSSGLGLPSALRRASESQQSARSDRRFTIHPDENHDGTVVHRATASQHPPVISNAENLPDLFSSAKALAEAQTGGKPLRPSVASPRQRPRISTQTFVKIPEEPEFGGSHATSSGSQTARPPNVSASAKSTRIRTSSVQPSPFDRRRITFTHAHSRKGSEANDNQKLAPNMHHLKGPGKQKAWHPGNVLERELTWPTDSVQDEWEALESIKEARFDGSADDAFNTARSHFSPTDVFSPTSKEVREICPRRSSLKLKARVARLEDEVALLRSEVAGLKQALERANIR